ncbi:5961_t:CDS:2, partial [Funneliformis geosporum]
IIDENKNPTDRYIYELSDLLIEIVRKGFINLNHIEKLLKEVQSEKLFIEDELEVCRTQPREYKFGEYTFWKSTIGHPLLIYELVEEYSEIENQLAESKQKATYLITKNNFQFVIETIKIFALLSRKHQKNVLNILRAILAIGKLDKEKFDSIIQKTKEYWEDELIRDKDTIP